MFNPQSAAVTDVERKVRSVSFIESAERVPGEIVGTVNDACDVATARLDPVLRGELNVTSVGKASSPNAERGVVTGVSLFDELLQPTKRMKRVEI